VRVIVLASNLAPDLCISGLSGGFGFRCATDRVVALTCLTISLRTAKRETRAIHIAGTISDSCKPSQQARA
jgi:hypothetical protein